MDETIEKHMGLVRAIVEKFNPRNDTVRQDLIAAGTVGLWKALEKYDKTKGKASTFLWKPIKWCVMQELKIIKKNREVSLTRCRDPQFLEEDHLWEFMDSESISNEEREIVTLRSKGYKFREIGHEIGKSKAAAENKFYRTIKKIRELNE